LTRGSKKKLGRAGGVLPPARSETSPEEPIDEGADQQKFKKDDLEKGTKIMPSYGRTETLHAEGVTVIGEAVRIVLPERAEFFIEVTASSQTAAQAFRDNHAKTTQITQLLAPLGVTQADIQPISQQVHSLYSPLVQSLPPAYAGMLPIGPGGMSPFGAPPGVQPEIQFGSYQARNTLRVSVREPARVGEIADALARAGVTSVGAFSFHAAEEGSARRAVLETAGKDAKSKAEALASAAGRQVGDLVTITEDIVASNGTYAALRTAMPFAFGPTAPQVAGELQYYARVTATFSLQ